MRAEILVKKYCPGCKFWVAEIGVLNLAAKAQAAWILMMQRIFSDFHYVWGAGHQILQQWEILLRKKICFLSPLRRAGS